mmetsp:Transcript_37694/g.120944  ORF Transcript_37694/g.120944 Transcript_37694/m.120944 type:complete len:175 (+) Transcript_37694:41-565(+)
MAERHSERRPPRRVAFAADREEEEEGEQTDFLGENFGGTSRVFDGLAVEGPASGVMDWVPEELGELATFPPDAGDLAEEEEDDAARTGFASSYLKNNEAYDDDDAGVAQFYEPDVDGRRHSEEDDDFLADGGEDVIMDLSPLAIGEPPSTFPSFFPRWFPSFPPRLLIPVSSID